MIPSPRSIGRVVTREARRFRYFGRYGLKADVRPTRCCVAQELAIKFTRLIPGITVIEPYETVIAEVGPHYPWSKIRLAQKHPQAKTIAAYELARAYDRQLHDSKKRDLNEEIEDYATHLLSDRPFISMPR
jgi:hypothetical protein